MKAERKKVKCQSEMQCIINIFLGYFLMLSVVFNETCRELDLETTTLWTIKLADGVVNIHHRRRRKAHLTLFYRMPATPPYRVIFTPIQHCWGMMACEIVQSHDLTRAPNNYEWMSKKCTQMCPHIKS